jgi:pimeloyl-ACP methyl ester carboxylesterase
VLAGFTRTIKEFLVMATFVLIHGAGDVGWYWHLVERELRARGHHVVAPDLPIEDDAATFSDYADAVVDAVDERVDGELVVVGMSFGGYTAPIVCDRLPASHLVLVSPMIPQPGESAEEMFANTGYEQEPQEDSSDLTLFYHDIPEELGKEALSRGRNQSGATWTEPWPLAAWPDVPVACVLSRDDRLFPVDWLRKVAVDRLGVTPVEIDSGHCSALSHPVEIAGILEGVLGS